MAKSKAGFVYEGETGEAVRAIKRLEVSVTKAEKSLKGMGRAGKSTGESFDGMGLAKQLAGWVSVGGAIAAATVAMQEHAAIRKSTLEDMGAIQADWKRLVQISLPEDLTEGWEVALANFQRAKALGDVLGTEYGMGQGRYLFAFEALSSGFTEAETKNIAVFRKFADDITSVMRGVAGVKAAYGREALGGKPAGITGGMLSAAAIAKVGIEDIAGATLAMSAEVKAIKGTAAESIAALGPITFALDSTQEATTAIARLAQVMRRDEEMKTAGLFGAMRLMMEMTEGERDALIGENVRARRGYDKMTEAWPKIQKSFENIQIGLSFAGTEYAPAAMAKTVAEHIPALAGEWSIEKQQARLEIAKREAYLGPEQTKKAIGLAMEAELVRMDASLLRRARWKTQAAALDLFDASPERYLASAKSALPHKRGLEFIENLPPELQQRLDVKALAGHLITTPEHVRELFETQKALIESNERLRLAIEQMVEENRALNVPIESDVFPGMTREEAWRANPTYFWFRYQSTKHREGRTIDYTPEE